MKTMAVAIRVIRQIVSDKRNIAFLLIAPIFVLFLLQSVLNSAQGSDIIIYNVDVSINENFEADNAEIIESDIEKAENEIINNKADAYMYMSGKDVKVVLNGSDSQRSVKALAVIKQAVAQKSLATIKDKINLLVAMLPSEIKSKIGENDLKNLLLTQPEIITEYKYGKGIDSKMFDSLAPIIIGFIAFFFTFIFSGIAFLREKITCTIDRMMTTPIKRRTIVGGYFIGFGIFIAAQTIIMQVFSSTVLGIDFAGNYFLLMFIYLLLAAQSLALGLALSAFARNEFQLFQFIPVIIIPQVLFCGLFDISGSPVWITTLSKIFPLTYAADAIKKIAIQGKGFNDVLIPILVLTGFLVLFLVFNALVLRRHRAA